MHWRKSIPVVWLKRDIDTGSIMKTVLLASTMLGLLSLGAAAHAHPFEAGQLRLGAGGGGGVGGWSLGVSAGYFVAEGVELGLGTTYIRADEMSLLQATGSSTYVFAPDAALNPYAGGFARHWFVLEGNVEPQSSVGARGGVYSRASQQIMLGIGAVYETILDCDDGDACDSVYPEFSLSMVF